MKIWIVFIVALSIFLASNYTHATIPVEYIHQTMEKARANELTPEDMQELFINILASIDSNDLEQIVAGNLNLIDYVQQEEAPLCTFLYTQVLLGILLFYFVPFLIEIPFLTIPFFFTSLFWVLVC